MLEAALATGTPEVFNTDQVQFMAKVDAAGLVRPPSSSARAPGSPWTGLSTSP